jgi:putative PIN family toxin of toxin-antitoxin system
MSYAVCVKRVVLDTSVVVAAFRSRQGASNAVLGLVSLRRLVPLATVALFLEYEEVLKRPEHREAAGLTLEQVDRILASLASVLEPVEVHYAWRPQLDDVDDELVLEAAINGRAEGLVTHNVRDFADVASRFGLEVIRPGALLRRIRP